MIYDEMAQETHIVQTLKLNLGLIIAKQLGHNDYTNYIRLQSKYQLNFSL